MRKINAEKIRSVIKELSIIANTRLRADVLGALRSAFRKEKNVRAKDALRAIIENAEIARKENLALCQDTGLPRVFVELGQEVIVKGGLRAAINKGIAEGYRRGYLRRSVVKDPLSRGKPGYSPAVIDIDIVGGSRMKLTVLPKGFGSENKSRLIMLSPTEGVARIKEFVVETAKLAGPDACPPFIIGVGIGGTADHAALLAKKALLGKLGKESKLEKDLFKAVNNLMIGPMGLGGRATCLGVKVLTYPTHIAGLPVAVNICCHALRSATRIL